MILSWEKPAKVMSTERWKQISADGAPPGVYVPNMSEADRKKWKAKYVGGKIPRVEIRKSTDNGTQVLIVVTEGGFPGKVTTWNPTGVEQRSADKNVRISQNGPAFYSFEEIAMLRLAVEEAKIVLREKQTER